MSKVKPQVGQIWKDPGREGDEWVVTEALSHEGVIVVECSHNKYSDIMPDGGTNAFLESDFVEFFEFIPQNDLEWLAVKAGAWEFDDCDFIAREESRELYIEDSESEYCSQFQYYTHQQWQNMRYKLGLDEKPRVSAEKWAEMLRDKQ